MEVEKFSLDQLKRQIMIFSGREQVEVQSLFGEKAIARELPVCRVR